MLPIAVPGTLLLPYEPAVEESDTMELDETDRSHDGSGSAQETTDNDGGLNEANSEPAEPEVDSESAEPKVGGEPTNNAAEPEGNDDSDVDDETGRNNSKPTVVWETCGMTVRDVSMRRHALTHGPREMHRCDLAHIKNQGEKCDQVFRDHHAVVDHKRRYHHVFAEGDGRARSTDTNWLKRLSLRVLTERLVLEHDIVNGIKERCGHAAPPELDVTPKSTNPNDIAALTTHLAISQAVIETRNEWAAWESVEEQMNAQDDS